MDGITMTEIPSILFLNLLMMVSGGLGGNWNVIYSPTYICALEGSSVNLSCSYTYPSRLTVTQAYWINQESGDATDITKNANYAGRVRVDCGDKKSQCSLHLTKLTTADALQQYYCRIITNADGQKWIGKPGIELSITDLRIVSSTKGGEVKEGDHVTITCKHTCPLTSPLSFIWSKDGRPVEKKQIINNQLQLHPVSYEDEGSYTCALKGHDDHPSLPMRMTVKCQKMVSLSSSSSAREVMEGDNVTLSCSITNCPLTNSPSFIWSKDGRLVENKQIINNQLQLHPVSYEDEGNYTCAVRGHEGLPSRPFRLQLMSVRSPVGAAVAGVAAVCGAVGLFCVVYWLRSHKKINKRAEERDEKDQDQDDGQYSNISFQRSGDRSRSAGPPRSSGSQGDDVQYASVQPRHSRQTAGAQGDDVQYASVQPRHSRQTAGAQGDDVQYASVQFKEGGAAKSSPDQPEGEPSVIYSSVQMGVQK